MATRAWAIAVVVACAHGIRQEAATELPALPLAQGQPQQLGQEGDFEPSTFAEQRRGSGAAPLTNPAGGASRHRNRHHRRGPIQPADTTGVWWDKSGTLCEPGKACDECETEFFYPLNGSACTMAHFCVHSSQGWKDERGTSCAPGQAHGDPHRGAVFFDKKRVPCYPKDWAPWSVTHFQYAYENGEACTVVHFCMVFASGWLDENTMPCDPHALIGGGHASATDDPHLVSLSGERFDVKQPGQHSLLQVPLGGDAATAEPPLLTLDGDLRATEGAPCGLYVKTVALSGRWLDGKVVRIRPSDEGGGTQQRLLSVQVGAASEATVAAADGRPWSAFGSPAVNESLAEASTQMVRALAVRREELGPFSEGQAFRFELLGSGSKQRPPASITVSQGSRGALNVALDGMAGLGHARLGGLLGTESHDRGLEVPTEECRESRAQGGGGSLLLGLVDVASNDLPSSSPGPGVGDHEGGSRMQAAWE